jgi:ornithine decarboxylase
MSHSTNAPKIQIPFQRLLKVVALVDEKNEQARALLERIAAQGYEVEINSNYERDVPRTHRSVPTSS